MAEHNRVNRRKYEIAQDRIRTGVWVIDPHAGTLYSTKFRRPIVPHVIGGYVTASVWIPETKRSLLVFMHRVVWEHVNGPVPDDYQVNHMDGDKLNNNIANLEVTTASENVRHAHLIGLHPRDFGDKTRRQVLEAIRAGGLSHLKIGQRFGVSTTYVAGVSSARPEWRKLQHADPDRTEKRCTCCEVVRPIGEFHYRAKGSRDGRVSRCRRCKRCAIAKAAHTSEQRQR